MSSSSSPPPPQQQQDLGKSRHGIPDMVMTQIDKYVDSLKPHIEPRIAKEIEAFQQSTIESLEDQIIAALRSLFKSDPGSYGGTETPAVGATGSRSIDNRPPEAYGERALPFANELATLMRSLQDVADDVDNDLRGILNLTGAGTQQQQQYGGQSRGLEGGSSIGSGARGFISAAIEAVSDVAGGAQGGGVPGQTAPFGGILDVLSDAVKDASRDPDHKARMLSPEVRDKVGTLLSRQHAPIASMFTDIALSNLKRWLRGNTSSRDLGDEVKGKISSLVKGVSSLFSGSKEQTSRDDASSEHNAGGVSGVISNKLSTGLAQVHREVRVEFRTVLGSIEKQLFEALPDQIQGPLERVFGGNPFDPALASTSGTRGFGDDLKAKLVDSLRRLIRRLQQTLQTAITSLVAGGHRKLEGATWGFVQHEVEAKVRKFLPKVRITVPDDIGNEGVSVGQPQIEPGQQQPSVAPLPSNVAAASHQDSPSMAPQQAHGYQGHPGQPYSQQQTQQQHQSHQQQPQYPQPFNTNSQTGGSGVFPVPQAHYQQPLPPQYQQQQPQHSGQQQPPYYDGVIATQKFRSTKATAGRRQNQQDAVVEDWEADSDGGEPAGQVHDPFRASKDEWTRANDQTPASMPMPSNYGPTLPPTAYGSGLSTGGDSDGYHPASGFPQPQIGGVGGGGGAGGLGPAPPKILQRPRDVPAGVGMGGPSAASNAPIERKTVEQRQEEYRLARARIFGDEAR